MNQPKGEYKLFSKNQPFTDNTYKMDMNRRNCKQEKWNNSQSKGDSVFNQVQIKETNDDMDVSSQQIESVLTSTVFDDQGVYCASTPDIESTFDSGDNDDKENNIDSICSLVKRENKEYIETCITENHMEISIDSLDSEYDTVSKRKYLNLEEKLHRYRKKLKSLHSENEVLKKENEDLKKQCSDLSSYSPVTEIGCHRNPSADDLTNSFNDILKTGSPLNEHFKQQMPKISDVLKQQSLMKSILSDVLNSISRLESSQSRMMSMVSDSFNSSSRLESKLESLVAPMFNSSSPTRKENESSLLKSLPAQSDEKFAELNKMLEEDVHHREYLVNYLSCIGGKDPRSLICNMLRRLLVDNVAQNFSLTGKQHKKSHKKAFETTEVYKAIFDICKKFYPNITQDKVRHICGDWLHQAKVRINRLQQRKVASNTDQGKADECNL